MTRRILARFVDFDKRVTKEYFPEHSLFVERFIES